MFLTSVVGGLTPTTSLESLALWFGAAISRLLELADAIAFLKNEAGLLLIVISFAHGGRPSSSSSSDNPLREWGSCASPSWYLPQLLRFEVWSFPESRGSG